MDNKDLNVQVKANAEQAIMSINKLKSELTTMGVQVDRISNKYDKQGRVVSQSFTTSYKNGEKLYKTVQKIDSNGNLTYTNANYVSICFAGKGY